MKPQPKHMKNQTKEENRATVRYCAARGWCSLPDYAHQDQQLEIARTEERLRMNRQLGRLA